MCAGRVNINSFLKGRGNGGDKYAVMGRDDETEKKIKTWPKRETLALANKNT